MEYRVLGPTEVVDDDGRTVPLGGPQRRALLAALLIRAGEACSADWLAGALWGDDAVDDPTGRLHPLVSRLRSALEPPASGRDRGTVLQSVPGGYRLIVEPQDYDAARFESLVAQAETAAVADPDQAVGVLEAALALWRGPALTEVADRPFAMAEAVRLEERRLAAQELRLEILVALGRHAEGIAELQSLVDRHPLRERLWALLMLALYRAGRQADALRAFGEVRSRLIDELGIEPGRELRGLELAILDQAPDLDDAAPWTVGEPRPAAPPSQGRRPPGSRLPPTLGPADRSPFVGRANERAALDSAWQAAAEGGVQLVLVTGEPGVGKTSLAADLARRVAEGSALVLAGRCDEGLAVPYQPFVEALRHQIARTPDHELVEAVGRLGGELVRLLPELAERAAAFPAPLRSDTETERYRLFDAVAAWLCAASERTPVLLVLDDLQWAAPPTLLLLRHVLRSAEPLRLLVVATYRETDLDRAHPLIEVLGDLRRHARVERLALEGLDEAEIGELLAANGVDIAAVDLTGVARAVQLETAGNPLFARELVRHYAELAAASGDGRGPLIGSGIPEGVREVVAARVARLSPEAALVLERAAVAGAEIDLALLAAVTGLRDDALDEALEEVIVAGLLVTPAGGSLRYRFAHGLARSSVYEAITPSRRARLHATVAEALEARGEADEDLDALAEHWARAAPAGYADRAADCAARAGLRAFSMLAYETAVARYRAALEALDGGDEERRLSLLVALGEAQAAAADITGSKASYAEAADLAEARGDAERLADAALGYGTAGVTASMVDTELVALLERAAAQLPAEDGPLRVKVLARLAAELYFSGEDVRRTRLSEEAVAMGRRCGDADALAFALSSHHYVLWGPDGLEERIAVADHLRALAAKTGDTELILQGHRWSIIDLLELGDIEGADDHIQRYAALATELGRPIYRWWAGVFRAMRLLFVGDFDQAGPVAEEAWRIGRHATEAALQFYGLQSGIILRERGQLEGVEPIARMLVERFPLVPAWRCALAVLYADLGRLDEAAAEIDVLGAQDFADLPRDLGWLPAIVNVADVSAAVGDTAKCELVFDLLEPYAEHNVVIGAAVLCHGSAARPLARLAASLGRHEDAFRFFEQALVANRSMGATPLVAHTEHDYARALLARDEPGDAERAQTLLTSASATARDLGMAALAARSAEVMPARNPPARPTSGVVDPPG